MTRFFRSTTIDPRERGREFGAAHASQIKSNVAAYQRVFASFAKSSYDVAATGRRALAVTAAFAPPLHEEMLGMADGAAIDVAMIGMLNARTEILAQLKAPTGSECSAVICLPPDGGPPSAVQTWDWFYSLKDSWFVWEIPLPDGTVTKTMTEYGIVGKAGLNTRGLGLLFTILHHLHDGARIGVPVHVAARWTLDTASNIAGAAKLLATADVSASSSINLVSYEHGGASAITVELHPGGPGFVLPDERGHLVHTNHFLAPAPALFDTEPKTNPDTLLRHNLLRRRLARHDHLPADDLLVLMASHAGAEGAVCCHHDPAADPLVQYETLATVILDVAAGRLTVLDGGPCRGAFTRQP